MFNREFDDMIALEVMEWEDKTASGWYKNGSYHIKKTLFKPSTSPSDVFRVINKMMASGSKVSINTADGFYHIDIWMGSRLFKSSPRYSLNEAFKNVMIKVLRGEG